MAYHIKSAALRTGVTLQYVEQGDASGIPVLLLHGISDSWHSFELLLPHMPQSIRAFALTQRGHGDSSRPETAYRFQDYTADAAALMDALQLEAAVIVGHSMGSAIAQRFAIEHPERTLGLVLVGAFANLPNSAATRELWDVVSTLEDPVDPAFVREFQESTLAQPVPQAFFEKIVEESLKLPAPVWKSMVACILQADDFSGELDKIKSPTLIVWGDHDGSCPRSDQEALTEAISDSRLAVYRGAGHATHWEEPKKFAADLVSFIQNSVN